VQSAGIDPSAVIAIVCRYLDIEEKQPSRPARRENAGIFRFYEFSQHRRTGCIGVQKVTLFLSEPLVATQNLSIHGSDVAHRFEEKMSQLSLFLFDILDKS
jgi:hypothetical protein